MHIPKTYLSLHDITALRATAIDAVGHPLAITVETEHGATVITLFLQPYLAEEQVKALAEVITGITTMPPAKPAQLTPDEKAAYEAADGYWARLKLDLNRGLITPFSEIMKRMG